MMEYEVRYINEKLFKCDYLECDYVFKFNVDL